MSFTLLPACGGFRARGKSIVFVLNSLAPYKVCIGGRKHLFDFDVVAVFGGCLKSFLFSFSCNGLCTPVKEWH